VDIFIATFALFGLAVLGMAVGLIVKGKRLSGSCGGRGPDGRPLADCLCARENRPTCDTPPAGLAERERELAGTGAGRD
jgi:hypothetical protein